MGLLSRVIPNRLSRYRSPRFTRSGFTLHLPREDCLGMENESWEGRDALESALEEMMSQKEGQKPSASRVRGVAKISLENRSEYKRIVHSI